MCSLFIWLVGELDAILSYILQIALQKTRVGIIIPSVYDIPYIGIHS